MNQFFIYYNNGYFESTNKINPNLLHLIEVGVIKLIINSKDNNVWIRGEEGIAKQITIPEYKES